MEDRSSRRVRTLVTLTAQRGLSANKIACALISMMARSTCSNRRPNTLTQDRISQRRPNPLAPHGRTIHWVKPGITRAEHNESALPQAADIELTLQEVRAGPTAEATASCIAIA